MVPVGLAGLPISTPLSGARRCAASSMSGVIAQRVACVRLDQHRLAAERGQDMAIGRVAGHCDRHPVAGLEQREKGEDEAAGRAGGDDHAIGIDRYAVGIGIVAGNARPQRRNSERLGVADSPGRERSARGGDRSRRCGRRRLPDLHMDDAAARVLDAGGRRHHVHHHERRHVAAQRRLDQASGGVQHPLSSLVGGNRDRQPPAPLLPYSAASVRTAPSSVPARYQVAGAGAMGRG